mmetsp:Transcript_9154/g.25606  ORF Transcript_9154/g.25606 Transcript_9154/m.25606 type:complete len:512 (-) Transcript_9154:81-1616(-)
MEASTAKQSFEVQSCVSSLSKLLTDESFHEFLDTRITFEDGEQIGAHRSMLALASDVLKAKFAGSFQDSAQKMWTPEVGSSQAWRWLVSWIYGCQGPLAVDLVVDVFVLADYLQMNDLLEMLVEQMSSLQDTSDSADVLVRSTLTRSTCPAKLVKLVKLWVPRVRDRGRLMDAFWQASCESAAVLLGALPVCFEADRVKIACRWVSKHRLKAEACFSEDANAGETVSLPKAFLHQIAWHAFPTSALSGGCSGDMSELSELCGVHLELYEEMHQVFLKAIMKRSAYLEQFALLPGELQLDVAEKGKADALDEPASDGYLTPLGLPPDLLRPPTYRPGLGLLALLSSQQIKQHPSSAPEMVSVHLSSRHVSTPADNLVLFQMSTKTFGTSNQHQLPWIAVHLHGGLAIQPTAVGLKHGWTAGRDICKTFVLEASCSDGDWRELWACSNELLLVEGKVYALPKGDGTYFQQFRIRMTGRNSNNEWYLMVAWFEIFGHLRGSEKVWVEAIADENR